MSRWKRQGDEFRDRALRPGDERDACGTGFIAHRNGRKSHELLREALQALENLEHRGAVSTDGKSSDGAGILAQVPWRLLQDEIGEGIDEDRCAVAMVFLPGGDDAVDRREEVVNIVERRVADADLEFVTWRDVPTNPGVLGGEAGASCPEVRQFVVRLSGSAEDDALERSLYLVRRRIEKDVIAASAGPVSIPSFSSRTIVYKGLVLPGLLAEFYPDLADERFETSVALFHQRYSTNTSPTWDLAQPLRFLAHNGEINTLLGNVNRMRAREPEADESVWGDDVYDLVPVVQEGASDSMALDNAFELLVRSGRDMFHSMAMLVPAAHETDPGMDDETRAFYRFHEALMEPWDGPAALVFTDGRVAGAALDRNGLRPLRYWVTADDRVIVGSETGIVPVPESEILEKGRLGPGRSFGVDVEAGEILRDDEIKSRLASLRPWREWLCESARPGDSAVVDESVAPRLSGDDLVRAQHVYGYGREHLERVFEPMYTAAKTPVGSMGDDTPLAVLSQKPQRLYRFFKQRFAQVTNPPIDSLRERMVMSLTTRIGLAGALLREDGDAAKCIEYDSPILSSEQLAWLESDDMVRAKSARLHTRFRAEAGTEGLQPALEALCREAVEEVRGGARVLILSDRDTGPEWAPIPMLLATAAVHHRLIDEGVRMRTAIVCDAGDVIEDHDVACLLGFGAMFVHPYLAYNSVAELVGRSDEEDLSVEDALVNYRATLETGLLKIMAKMGISCVASYRGAQIFEALGISPEIIDRYFTGTPTRIGGAGMEMLAANALAFHQEAHGEAGRLTELGIYRFRRGGEYHAFNPKVFTTLHKAVRKDDFEIFTKYADQVDDRPPMTIRDLLEWREADTPIPLEEVESAEDLVRRFSTQAMSFGSLSRETHETLAVAMNRLGAKSNSGEGGEEDVRFERYTEDAPERSVAEWHPKKGDLGSSYIKQVASGRFGVTPRYLVSARELEIKMAQGSKPGEGGQIPGYKVTEEIARTRRSIPGVTLISPPPHHDIYSIEDLAQLIYDLKRVNDEATVCVKLVSGIGVGTIAAGVAKGYADTIQVSGHDGGTGASPLSSIKHAGLPWELGLTEVQRSLVQSDLRGRVKLRADGGFKTGRDVVIAAMLGAEEFGFGTAALVAAGCVMARQCHSNTCPVGIATQRADLRERYPGSPENVVSFMIFVAEHVRRILARIGVRRLDDIVGRTDLLAKKSNLDVRATSVDVDAILADADPTGERARHRVLERNVRPEEMPLDEEIFREVLPHLDRLASGGEPVCLDRDITNRQRTVGARLAGEIARRMGGGRLQDGAVRVELRGRAGQSFGAFCNHGMRLVLYGEAQDYVGKGQGGGEIIIRPPDGSNLPPHEQVVLGNTVRYGATDGVLFASGIAGERLGVRNSGGNIVVEGCGDHGCEYMTGGTVVVLGETGLNFGAGMSGGEAFVWDPDSMLDVRYNDAMIRLAPVEADAAERLRTLIEAHVEKTASPRGRSLFARWAEAVDEFRHVIPR